MGNLTALKISKPGLAAGRYGDGDGLYLVVKPSGTRSWVLRIQQAGKRRDIGLGSFDGDGRERGEVRPSDELSILQKRHLTLAEARAKAKELRRFAMAGKDPIVERDRERTGVPLFRDAVTSTHEALKSGWTEQTAENFLRSLEVYADPALGCLRVDAIEASHFRDLLAPIWTTKPDLARKVRVRIGQVLNFSHSKGWRATEAPRKSVSVGLPKQPKGSNFRAMPYAELPDFARAMTTSAPTTGRRALMFLILTAARPGEVRLARWDQIDLTNATWVRPGEMMKLKTDHMVTLSPAAVALLAELKRTSSASPDALVFPSRSGRPLSDMAMTKVLRDAGLAYDAHGFRSTFRDWAAESMPTIPDPVAEAALAHAVPDKTVRAYKRTTFLAMRRELLDAWGRFVTSPAVPEPKSVAKRETAKEH